MEKTNHVLLSVRDLNVKFRVRGRILTAIRGISLDIYKDESIAIVGESGSGKSVFTKTFAGMLDENGYIESGDIIFDDPTLADTKVSLDSGANKRIAASVRKLNEYAQLEAGALTYNQIQRLKEEKAAHASLSPEEEAAMDLQISDLVFQRTELFNLKQTFDPRKEVSEISKTEGQIRHMDQEIRRLQKARAGAMAARKKADKEDTAFHQEMDARISSLQEQYQKDIAQPISEEQKQRNVILAKEIELSVGRYKPIKRSRTTAGLLNALHDAMQRGDDLTDDNTLNAVFDPVTFRVRYLDETPEKLHGTTVLNLAKVKDATDWTQIRGTRIATVFQDPMTSLNPIITIGKQITSIIIKHQKCSEVEARKRALELMMKVGIPNAEKRFDDYPFQYSGGMRQRIVIAIALSCQPKILICDEPTTALDVTIQAQIIRLIKDLQKELGFTTVYITHDLGVVANVAERVAVIYGGQIVEIGTVEDIFYDPRHPYTWALLSSLPQLCEKGTDLFSIPGTPPSLYNKIIGDAFAPRNQYAMAIDLQEEPPMFQVSDTHFAKTWLLDPRAPKTEAPKNIQNLHEKMVKIYGDFED